MEKNAAFDETVIRLYDATTDLDKWPAFLESLGRLFDAEVSQVLHYSFEEERLTFRAYRGYEHVGAALIERYDELAPNDPVVQHMMRHPEKPTTIDMVLDEASYNDSALHKEIFAPTGLGGYERTIAVFIEPRSFIGIGRRAIDPPFDHSDVDRFGRLVPHLKQALELHHRLAQLETERADALAVLDKLPTGIILANARGVIRQANRTALQIMARKDGLLLIDNVIAARRPNENAQLLKAISTALSNFANGANAPGTSVSVSRRDGKSYPLLVSALGRNLERLGLRFLPTPLAVLFVTDPDRPQEVPAELLQRLYGFTKAEAALAEQLVTGKTLKEVAAIQEVSRNTLRTHLRSLFEKTGTRRQAELVMAILQSPVWISAQQSHEDWERVNSYAIGPGRSLYP